MSTRRCGRVAVLLSIALALPASAQVVLRHTWTPPGGTPQVCVITTDGVGVTMASDGTLVSSGSFGAGCPSGSGGVNDPAITDGIDAAEIPATATAGATYSVRWSANADSCSYSGSSLAAPVANWPTTGNVCSSAAECATGRTVAVTMPATPGAYKFELSCRRTGSGVVATSTRSTFIDGNGACVAPAGLTRVSQLHVETSGNGSNGVFDFDNPDYSTVYGHNWSGGADRPFPGTQNQTWRLFLPQKHYVSLRFTVPSDMPEGREGNYVYTGTNVSGKMAVTISKQCGDFNPLPSSPMNAKCALTLNPGDSLPWGHLPGSARVCVLEPGQTYYLNVLFANLAAPATPTCTRSPCDLGLMNARTDQLPNPWPLDLPGSTE